MKTAVTVDRVSKRFRLFKERNQTLKHVILRGRRAVYEEFWALKDVSFSVPTGSTFGLIGENGSGKSTMLKCLAQILTPDAGTIRTDGRVSALLELGAGFHPELSGRENIFLNGTILGLSGRDLKQRFDEIVAFSGIERFIDTPVKNYSSGMYVRLGFSIAINVEPDILLIDEVLAVGDEEFQQKCRSKFTELRAKGSTIIIVSHAMELVGSMCDNSLWLENGQVRSEGMTDAVIAAYMEHVHGHDRPLPQRHGEASIGSVDVLVGGQRTDEVPAGSAATLRIGFTAETSIERPVFTIQLFSESGIELARISSANAEPGFLSIHGQGHVDVHFSSLPLVSGTYRVVTSLSEKSSGHLLDRNDATMFQMQAPSADAGLLSLDPTWELGSAGKATA